ncbi:MAG: GAF domain-containing protein [Dehalococcoidia bacterium]
MEMAVVDEVAKIVTSTLDLNEVYEKFALEVKKLVPFDRINITLVHSESATYETKFVYGQDVLGRLMGDIRPLVGTATGAVVATAQTLILEEIGSDYPYDNAAALIALGLRSAILTPLFAGGRVIGTLGMHSFEIASYGSREQALLERLASQIAPAIENAQLYDQAKAEMAVADGVARIITSTLDINQVYDQFAQEVKKLVDFDRMSINTVDLEARTFTVKYQFGAELPEHSVGTVRPFGDRGNQQAVLSAQTTITDDVDPDTDIPTEKLLLATGLHSSIAVPLISKGQAFATMLLRSKQVGAYDARKQAILERLAAQIAPAIENAQLYDQAKAEMAVADEVARIITSTLDIGDVFEGFAQEVKRLVDFDRINIRMVDFAAGQFTIKYLSGPTRSGHDEGAVIPLEDTQTQAVANTGKSRLKHDVLVDPQYSGEYIYPELGLRSSVMVPLISQGTVLGVLGLRCRRVGAYGERELAIVERLANQIAPALENSLLYEEIRESESRIQQQAEVVQHTNLELTKANDAKREFLAHMSHELRTPLNAVLVFARLLTEPAVGPINAKQERYLANIETSGLHLLQLINDIIDISKIEAGKMDLNISRIDVRECLTSCYSIAAGMASNKDIKFRAKYPPAGTVIYGDDRKIKELLLNLLSNAIKFTPEGGTVLFNSVIADQELRISVIDSGIGIDSQYQERIFEAFDQGDPEVAKIYGGSGLGLPLVKQMVELHNGKVWLESSSGKGSTFSVTLPLMPVQMKEVSTRGHQEVAEEISE